MNAALHRDQPRGGIGNAGRLLTILLLVFVCLPARAQDRALEHAVEAAYLYKFAPFVIWPNAATAPGSPFTICVLGDDTLAAELDRVVAGQSFNGHPFRARRLAAPNEAVDCQILYLGGDAATDSAGLAAARGSPDLTVTHASPGAPTGIINFVVIDGHVRFAIDLNAAARNGLAISSKLLSLAVSVEPAPGQRQP